MQKLGNVEREEIGKIKTDVNIGKTIIINSHLTEDETKSDGKRNTWR